MTDTKAIMANLELFAKTAQSQRDVCQQLAYQMQAMMQKLNDVMEQLKTQASSPSSDEVEVRNTAK